jgi:general secretion pathway protein M
MVKLDRDQAFAIGALCLLVLMCALTVAISIESRSDALQVLDEKRALLARLEQQSRPRFKQGNQQNPTAAPTSAFLNARTQGLASAELLTYVTRLAAEQGTGLISSGIEPAAQSSPDEILIQASMDMRSKALQALIFRLETGTPYMFVESLTVVPVNGVAMGSVQDPTLHVTVVLRALWRRDAA